MSTAYAFAAVSAVIRGRLAAYLTASGVSASVGGLTFTALPPDRVPTGAQEKNGINIFLYRVSRNQGWANVGPPTRNAGGGAVTAPPLGADLHYVISAYGADSFTGDILLGHVVAAFFEEPVLTRAAIRKALAPNPPDPTIPVPAAAVPARRPARAGEDRPHQPRRPRSSRACGRRSPRRTGRAPTSTSAWC